MAIEVQGLKKRFADVTVLAGVDFTVPEGESVALWGPNGAGKTTVLRCILGLLHYEGRILVDGLDAARRGKAVRRLIGAVSQRPLLYPDLTVEETVALSARLRGVSAQRAVEALEMVGLQSQASKPVTALSGGMHQRLSLAVALLGDPKYLLLDEPIANLDVASREATLRLLREVRRQGRSLIVTSHHLGEVGMLVDRVVVLDGGRVGLRCRPGDLAQRLHLRSWLHLTLEADATLRAVGLLRSEGLQARADDAGVLVEIPGDRKAEVIRLLERAGVRIRDFEVWR